MFLVSCWSAPGKESSVYFSRNTCPPKQICLNTIMRLPEMSLISTASSVDFMRVRDRSGRNREQVTSRMISCMDSSLKLPLHVDARHLKGLALTAFQACSLSLSNRAANIRLSTWLMFHLAVPTKSVMALSACFISWGVYSVFVEDKYLSLALLLVCSSLFFLKSRYPR